MMNVCSPAELSFAVSQIAVPECRHMFHYVFLLNMKSITLRPNSEFPHARMSNTRNYLMRFPLFFIDGEGVYTLNQAD